MKKVNLDDIPWVERRSPHGNYHKFRRDVARAMASPRAGSKLRREPPFEVEMMRLPPGVKNFPFHSHATAWEFYHYPDSNKWGWPIRGGAVFRKSAADYYDGEE